jgi:adenylate cyclase
MKKLKPVMETELTFLVRKLPRGLKAKRKEKILQGYFSFRDYPLRMRQKGKEYELTRKIPEKRGDFSCHTELTILLRKEEFKRLWPLTVKDLEKTRFYYPLPGRLTAEVDVFEGKLKGLIFVEVEFPNRKAMENFVPPNWFGRNVTQERWAVNARLAGKTFGQIKPFL